MEEELKLNIYDDVDILKDKLDKIKLYLSAEKRSMLEQEINTLNNIVKRISFLLPREEFSGKHGILIYKFEHKEKDREVYISPYIYLVDNNSIVYEVTNPKSYNVVSPTPIYKSHNGKYFCEVSLINTLNFICLEDIIKYIDSYINNDYQELLSIRKRIDYAAELNFDK